MSLPAILEVAIGLIFIYLILSLLASEIQELLTTLLQWRAEHLKKSIEILLAGGSRSPEEEEVIALANKLYSNPLIKNMNQQAKGYLVTIPRQITWISGGFYRMFKNQLPGNKRKKSVFGVNRVTGPSYLDSETFATTLLETLNIPHFSQKLTEEKLQEFIMEDLTEPLKKNWHSFKTSIDTLKELEEKTLKQIEKIDGENGEFSNLENSLKSICNDFKNHKSSLTTSLDRIAEKLELFIVNSEFHLSLLSEDLGKNFRRQMNSLKKNILGDTSKNYNAEITVLLGRLKPNITEVMNTYKMYVQAQKEIKDAKNTQSESYKKLQENYEELKKLYGEIEDAINIPPSTVKSLEFLAERAQERVKNAEEDINQLRREIELWFDRSMDRATGVYKRNAKGVAIIIGLLVAAAANADTFHIVSRLSKDSTLRTAITQRANQANIDEVNQALLEIPMPLGRDSYNLAQQTEESKEWKFFGVSFAERKFKGLPFPFAPRKWLGWLLSGIAIGMGAPFWFDLLGRVINVRNAGKPPESSANSQTSSDK